jgi:hypothetical protein
MPASRVGRRRRIGVERAGILQGGPPLGSTECGAFEEQAPAPKQSSPRECAGFVRFREGCESPCSLEMARNALPQATGYTAKLPNPYAAVPARSVLAPSNETPTAFAASAAPGGMQISSTAGAGYAMAVESKLQATVKEQAKDVIQLIAPQQMSSTQLPPGVGQNLNIKA